MHSAGQEENLPTPEFILQRFPGRGSFARVNLSYDHPGPREKERPGGLETNPSSRPGDQGNSSGKYITQK